jgi:hypothetical protein
VFFEGPDGAFQGVVAMSVGWHELVCDIIDGEEIPQSGEVNASLSRVWSFGLNPLTVSY